MKVSLPDPIERAKCSLEGLSVGDAFGETFFIDPDLVEGLIVERALADRTWNYTDDTRMTKPLQERLRWLLRLLARVNRGLLLDHPRTQSFSIRF